MKLFGPHLRGVSPHSNQSKSSTRGRVITSQRCIARKCWCNANGMYSVNIFDHNAIIGWHPSLANLLVANGFSGHGLQQSPAVGRGLSELILHGKYISIDLSPFEMERIVENRPIVEQNVI